MSTVETFSLVGPKVPSIPKSPGAAAILDYTFNWAPWLDLDADTIASATVSVSGVTLDQQTDAFPLVHCKVSGGVAGQTASVSCKILTAQGRTETRTIYLLIRVR